MGFPAQAPVTYEFPMVMFDNGSDLTPINENIDKIVAGLTTWAPVIKAKGTYTPAMVTVTGSSYQNAVDNVNAIFLKNMWGDGLPINPPTQAAVDKLLSGTPLSPDTVISPPGGVVPRGGIATVQSIAVALAMAGGRPEYMPVLIAAVHVITDPIFGLSAMNPTTNSTIPVIIVNGPIGSQIRLGSGYGCLGPDPQHPAGEVIGRTLRYIQQNLGGAIPGIGTMAIFGGMRSTNAVFAEDEAGLSAGWTSLAVRRGYTADQNVVTATAVNNMNNVGVVFGTKESNDRCLTGIAEFMATPDYAQWGGTPAAHTSPNYATGVVLIPRGFATSLAKVSGYSQADVQTFLWNHSQIPASVVMGWRSPASSKLSPYMITNSSGQLVLPVAKKPEQLTVVVAGGDQSGHCYWMGGGVSNHTMVSKVIQLPPNWNALLAQAVIDLGPIPLQH